MLAVFYQAFQNALPKFNEHGKEETMFSFTAEKNLILKRSDLTKDWQQISVRVRKNPTNLAYRYPHFNQKMQSNESKKIYGSIYRCN